MEQHLSENRTEESFIALSNLIAEPVIIISGKGQVLAANDFLEETTGFNSIDMVGKNFLLLEFMDQENKAIFVKNFEKRMKGREIGPCEIKVNAKNGEKKYFEVKGRKIKYAGELVDLVVFHDITRRKENARCLKEYADKMEMLVNEKVEEAKESEERSKAIFVNSPIGVATSGGNKRFLSANNAFCRIIGYTETELQQLTFKDIAYPEDVQESVAKMRDLEAGRISSFKLEKRYVRKDGTVINGRVMVSAIRDQIGKPSLFITELEDITELKQVENALLESEEKYRMLFEENMDAILVVDVEKGTIVDCNRAATKFFGRERSELVGQHHAVFTPQEQMEGGSARPFKQHVKDPSQILENKIITKTGEIKDVAVRAGLLDLRGRKVLLGTFTDITQRKKMEDALRESEQNFRSLSGKMWGLMKSSAVMLHSSDLRERLATIAEAVCSQGWKRTVISLKDESLETTEIVTAGLTKEEEEYLRTHQPSGEVWRKRLGSMFEHYRLGEFYYLPWSDPLVQEQFKYVVSSKMKKKETVDWNPDDLLYMPLRLPGGRVVGIMSMDDPQDGRRPTKESLAPLELFAHQAAIAIENARLIQQVREYAQDLEEKVEERTKQLKETQQQLLKSERLATIGELAGMVGHDLRNPLTGIAGATFYIRANSNKLEKKSKEMLEIIEEDVQRSNKIINDLLEYSREIKLELSETTPKSVLEGALSNIEIPENIQLRNLARDTPRIRVDAEKIRRVSINIIKNAVDAMQRGGTLTIRSKKTESNVEFSFTDTGEGMTKCMLDKLWTPLFTTKAKGMGFGLPICKRFVEAHGGGISVESEIGRGTTVTVIMPLEPKLEEYQHIWVNLPESLTQEKTGKESQGRAKAGA
jgi:PAS domain S-box-containing protein